MASFLTTPIRIKLIILGIYQLIGSLIGLLFSIMVAIKMSNYNFISLSIGILTFLFYLLNFCCGILLIIGNPLGLMLCIVSQIPQLISISISGFIFRYICGLYFSISINFSHRGQVSTDFRGSSYMFGLIDNPNVIVSLNIIAVVILIFIVLLRIEINKVRFNQQINLLGNDNIPQ